MSDDGSTVVVTPASATEGQVLEGSSELWNHRRVSSGLRLWVVRPETHLAVDPCEADIRVVVETLAPNGVLVLDHIEGSGKEGCSAQVLRPPVAGEDCLVIRLGAGTPQYAAFCPSLDEVITGLLAWVADPRRLPAGPSFAPVVQRPSPRAQRS